MPIKPRRRGAESQEGSPFAGHPWTETKFNGSIIMDATIKLVLGLSAYGMSQMAEVLDVVSKLTTMRKCGAQPGATWPSG